MKRPRKQPITKHNSSFWEITLARICNGLQIRNTRGTSALGFRRASLRQCSRHIGCRARLLHL